MEYKDVIASRHSVRKFKDQAIDRAVIDQIIDDAYHAPSSRGTRSSGFMIIEDRETLKAISEMRDFGSKLIGGAATAIVVLGDSEKSDLWLDNAAISATYILLSATALGLGSCWVHVNGRMRVHDDPSKGTSDEYLCDLLGIKENMKPLCVVALGYPDED